MGKQLGPWKFFLVYGLLATLIMLAVWPYLWENPIVNFIGVFRLMSDNPTNLAVLYEERIYRAGELPQTYLPFMLTTTLTEPVWILFFIGLLNVLINRSDIIPSDPSKQKKYAVSLSLVLAWFIILLAYVLIRKPAMYDGFRHFLFILPPVFVFAGFAIELSFKKIKQLGNSLVVSENYNKSTFWLRAGFTVLLIISGLVGIHQLHPYEYAYYNSFIGGTDKAFRAYETDYWLTCYKDAVEELNDQVVEPVNLFVKREVYIAAIYANENITVHDLRYTAYQIKPGDYVLVNTRTNDDNTTFKKFPAMIEIKRGKAIFCIVRQIQ
jgi:hypothetical protein